MPKEATSGASGSETLSPTPPVLCLSTLKPGMLSWFRMRPDCVIASVRSAVSALSMPRMYTAMRKADIW